MKEYKFTTKEKDHMEGMTVFNAEKVERKKQPMFLENLLEFKDMIFTNIQFLTN